MNVEQWRGQTVWFLFPFQTACLSTYEHKDLAEFLSGLWTSIRREVRFRVVDIGIEVCANQRQIQHASTGDSRLFDALFDLYIYFTVFLFYKKE
jgi:hypothetical protein